MSLKVCDGSNQLIFAVMRDKPFVIRLGMQYRPEESFFADGRRP
jgi:hypothetical protein